MLGAQPPQQTLMPSAAAAVAHQAGDLGLMHGVDHRRRGAGAAEHVADVDDVRRARALAAEFGRHRGAQQPLGARCIDRLFGKSRFGIDRRGMGRGHHGDLFRARHQRRGTRGMQIAGSDENTAHGAARDAAVFIGLLECHNYPAFIAALAMTLGPPAPSSLDSA